MNFNDLQQSYETGDDFRLHINKDPNLKDDTKLKFGDNEYSYREIREMFQYENQEPIRCLFYWDDIVQYTSLALIEVVNALKGLNATPDINHFLSRPNEYSNGLTYVFRIFEGKVSREEIIDIRNKYYWKILELSMKSGVFGAINRASSFFDRIGFWFPCRFDHADTLKLGLKDLLFKNKPNNVIEFHYGSKVSFNDVLKNCNYNSVFTPNMLSTYEYIIKKDLKRITIIGPEGHNGFTDEMLTVFEKYAKLPKPNYCALSFYKEQLFM